MKVSAASKPASAHDLRRSFGFRWSRKLLPQDLKEAIRHASIQTILEFYVGESPKETASAMFTAVSANKLANTNKKEASEKEASY